MSDLFPINLQQIKEAVIAQDVETTRLHLSGLKETGGTATYPGLLQAVAEHCADDSAVQLVFLLVAAGSNPDSTEGVTALQTAIRRRHLQTVRALLQCGVPPPEVLKADCRKPAEGEQEEEEDDVTALLDQFRPGLWAAVAEQRLGDVRRLLNLWCRTDLCREGVTLRRLALDTGNEPIISLILNIEPTMRCAFLVLARDEEGLADLMATPSGKKVNPNFRKQSERGAPMLYFAARSGSVSICGRLMDCGATIGLQMRDEDGADMPLIFALLHPSVPSDVIKCVLPPAVGEDGCSSPASRQSRQVLLAACYRSRNVLTHAVAAGLSPEMIETLLWAVGPELVCERGPDNLCLPERLAASPTLRALLRATIADWIGAAPPDELVPLLVRGCDWLEQLMAGDESPARPEAAGDEHVSAFLQRRRDVQAQVDALHRHLCEDGGDDELERLAGHLPDHWLWHARPTGDGTPLLVLAVLLSRPAAVRRLSRGLAAPDSVRDGFQRTPLHYASGTGCQTVRRALLKSGSSEHTLDVYGREPLDFADVVGSERLDELLRMRRNQEYGRPEPDPWEPSHRRQLQERRRRLRFQDSARHGAGHAHFPTAAGSDLRWPLPPDYSRATFAAAAPGGDGTASSSCVLS